MTIPLGTRFDILQRDHFTCRFCGRRAPETELEVDHLHPRSKGGSDSADNLVTACRDCNRGKGDREVIIGRASWDTLAEKWLHTVDAEGFVDRQGTIIGQLGDGMYFVQWFSWVDGGATSRTLVRLSDMLEQKWVFYRSVEMMHAAYDGQIGVKVRFPEEAQP